MDILSGLVKVRYHGKNNEIVDKEVNGRIRWDGLKTVAGIVTNIPNKDWYFKYQDEEGDTILGATELEWQSVVGISQRNAKFLVDIIPIDNSSEDLDSLKKMSIDIASDYVYVSSGYKPKEENNEAIKKTCCKPKTKINASRQPSSKCCDSSKKDSCDQTSKCCPMFERPMPDPYVDDGVIPVKTVNPTLDQYKYTNESLRAVTLPLGALGGGNLSIAGDGGLRQFQISNKVDHNAHVPNCFFAIKVGSTAAVLQSNTWYDQTGFKPAPIVTDHVVPPYSKTLLSKYPGVKTVEVTAKYPVVEVDYMDPKLNNVKVHLEAWSPKIPLDSKASGAPYIVFDFHVTNTSTTSAEVSLMSSFHNLVGWNGHDTVKDEVVCAGYGGNVNSLFTESNMFGMDMSNTSLPSNHEFQGNVSIVALPASTDKMSTMLQYTDVESLWTAFTKNTYLPGQGEAGVSSAGTTFNGAVNTSRIVAAGETTVFTYVLAWHFPNRYRDWTVGVNIPNTQIYLGNYYAKIWKTMRDLLGYMAENIANNRDLTYKFRDSMFTSTLPWQLIDSAAGRASVLNSPSCMWHADGNFYAFEGCNPTSGCCPLNCTHVWNFEMALAILYPDVERTMREIDLLHQITPHGVIPSRTPCPLELKRLWATWPDYSTSPTSTAICVDGEIGTIFKAYREYRHGASLQWLTSLWKPLKAVMNHWLIVLDEEKNGLVYGPQPNTYDVTTYGYLVAIGALYLCGLRAMEEMSKIMNDSEFEAICHDRFLLGTVNLDKQCFTNGKWYTQVVDPNHPSNLLGDSTQIGAMYGQWWAHILGLGYLLPPDHIKSHLKYTYLRNYVASFDPATQKPRVFCDQRDSNWVTAKWDDGDTPSNPLRYSSEWAWSGVIYPFAALLLTEGMTLEGLDVLKKTREMYDGTRRSPWNEIECGDHYSRPMSAFSLFVIASGQDWSFTQSGDVNLRFNPVISTQDFNGFFALGSCWGTFSQTRNTNNSTSVKLKIEYGELKLAKLRLNLHARRVDVIISDDDVMPPFVIAKVADGFSLNFPNTLHLSGGKVLSVLCK
ncbi:uncharacterized protein LOC130630273 [Hydractinia symbiolongicarpus]|uniref:uncharacterized protein LOC130630273 n=1 Tax=Hydractinia symbiolongicarpus TaxID=13093 RepID=UPI00254E8D4D|nr:uncharacterized protein LOC130630273 [Hydractinia symbiolongicarpus]